MSGGLGEGALHAIFQSSWSGRKGLSGPGEDCARLLPPAGRALVHSVDQLIEGVHVEMGTPPRAMAIKLLRRALSDLAAAGAQPWAVSWTIAAPPERGRAWARRLAEGFLAEAREFDLPVIGGDVARAPSVVLTAAVFGLEAKTGTPGRGGARAGDCLLVTGRLGGAVADGRHLRPEPRLREGQLLADRYRPGAMIDLSDGLLQDLTRVCEASGVGAEIDLQSLPRAPGVAANADGWRSALGDGEDYELLVALRPRQAEAALRDRVLGRAGLTAIGVCREQAGLRWQLDGRTWKPGKLGWVH